MPNGILCAYGLRATAPSTPKVEATARRPDGEISRDVLGIEIAGLVQNEAPQCARYLVYGQGDRDITYKSVPPSRPLARIHCRSPSVMILRSDAPDVSTVSGPGQRLVDGATYMRGNSRVCSPGKFQRVLFIIVVFGEFFEYLAPGSNNRLMPKSYQKLDVISAQIISGAEAGFGPNSVQVKRKVETDTTD